MNLRKVRENQGKTAKINELFLFSGEINELFLFSGEICVFYFLEKFVFYTLRQGVF